jgi:S1-C subfamily serine protease
MQLYSESSPSVLGFINKLTVGSVTPPDFPALFGTGFFVDSSGLAATNRHVIDFFGQVKPDPRTGQSALAAILFSPTDDGSAWQMLAVDVLAWNALSQFSSSDK